jgi:hypothetical protein
MKLFFIFKAEKLIKSLNDDKKHKLRNKLYEKFSDSKIDDLRKIASFIVAVEHLIFRAEEDQKFDEYQVQTLTEEQLWQMTDKNNQQPNENWADKTDSEKQAIKQYLLKISNDNQYSVILFCTPHGINTQNPHIINQTPESLIKDNLATTREELEDKLGKDGLNNITDTQLQKIIGVIATDFFNNIQKRGAGSHNIGFLIPRVFPNKKSPLNYNEKQKYLQNICQAINCHHSENSLIPK